MIKNTRNLFEKVTHYFDNLKMHQILLKYNNGDELTIQEKKDLDYWVYVYEHRNKLFKQLTLVIELHQQLKIINDYTDLLNLFRRVREKVPIEYFETSGNNDFYSLQLSISHGLKRYSIELCLRMIRGHMWGAIFSFIGVLLLMAALVFMVIWLS